MPGKKKREYTAREMDEFERLVLEVRNNLFLEWRLGGLTPADVSELCDISAMTVYNFASGKTQNPRLKTIVLIAHALGLRIRFTRVNDPIPKRPRTRSKKRKA